jgi:choline dehydrogenase-like flavoprotein
MAGSDPLYAVAFMQWANAAARMRSALRLRPGQVNRLGFSMFGTMAPSAEDFIALDSSKQTQGRAALLFALRHPPAAIRALEQARDELLGVFERADWRPRLRVYHLEAPGNSVHYGGTCRMHSSPRFGVVDASCRVHDCSNVVVADSAVFTTGPEKNPVLTAMTLAARASERLARDL